MPIELSEHDIRTARRLITDALHEDLRDVGDLTSQAVLPAGIAATVNVVCREHGRLSGIPVARMVFGELDAGVRWKSHVSDGEEVRPGTVIASVTGPVRSLLSGERTALNFLTHLSGVATLTDQFVQAIAGTSAVVLDTRKTLPAYRSLQKYAVRCGGGTNHRTGLFDAILIKDNHLAFLRDDQRRIPEVVKAAQEFAQSRPESIVIELEVDTLSQLAEALPCGPDIVLLDNMTPGELRTAVEMRDDRNPIVLLEASGGVNLQTVRAIAEAGVDRISIGALTHSAPALDIAFDWPEQSPADDIASR